MLADFQSPSDSPGRPPIFNCSGLRLNSISIQAFKVNPSAVLTQVSTNKNVHIHIYIIHVCVCACVLIYQKRKAFEFKSFEVDQLQMSYYKENSHSGHGGARSWMRCVLCWDMIPSLGGNR